MVNQDRIKSYAEKLRRQGVLKRLTLRNIALDLHLFLVQKKTEYSRKQIEEGVKNITLDLGTSLTLDDNLINLTFPVKSLEQAANPHSCHAILTSLAKVPGCQLEFCIDVPSNHHYERSQPRRPGNC